MTMKQLHRYSCLVALACMTVVAAHARTYNVTVPSHRGNLTQYLRETCKMATRNDTVVLNFGKGEFTIDGTVEFKCSAIIKGSGRDQSCIVLDKGADKSGFRAFTDDTYLMFHGSVQQPISVSISDLTLRLKEHKGIWWNESDLSAAKFAVKIYHANLVDIRRVGSYMSNAVITNFDFRVCSNVTVENCIVSNLNNCMAGGNLWSRGEQHNINIRNNKFYKYGNDELIGVYGNAVDATSNIKGNASRTDIIIEDNEIHYGYDGNEKDKDTTVANHTLITLQTADNQDNLTITTRNFHVKNNKIFINDECHRCFLVLLSKSDRYQGISFEGNQIIHSDLHSSNRYYREDFDIRDYSSNNDSIHIINNTITNKNSVLNNHNTVGYSFLLLRGGTIDMSGNKIVNTVTADPFTGKENGVQLVWCAAEGGTVTMRNNVCRGIKCIATVGAGDGTKQFKLKALNNYFSGDTRIYCSKIEQLDLNFTGNTFKSNGMNFFLQEFAQNGSVIFNNNDVTVKSGDGRFMTHWSNASTDSMKFTRLEVKGNVFRGVKGEQDMFKKITNVKKRSISSNKYVR